MHLVGRVLFVLKLVVVVGVSFTDFCCVASCSSMIA